MINQRTILRVYSSVLGYPIQNHLECIGFQDEFRESSGAQSKIFKSDESRTPPFAWQFPEHNTN